MRNSLLRTALCVVLPLTAFAQEEIPPEMEHPKDHPAVKRYPGSVEQTEMDAEFESLQLPVGKGGKAVRAEGRLFFGGYWIGAKTSCSQFLRNYENAFKAGGLKVSSGAAQDLPENFGEDKISMNVGDWVTGQGRINGKGPDMVATVLCENNLKEGNIVVIEKQAMEQKVEITADSLASEIEASGHVAIYGINFATGKSEITPDSAKILGTIAELLSKKGEWKLRVEGHTDNVGKPAANLALSKQRAAAVKDWLTQHGVDSRRLVSEGFGDARPIAPNTTDEGKAKNRRVELARLP